MTQRTDNEFISKCNEAQGGLRFIISLSWDVFFNRPLIIYDNKQYTLTIEVLVRLCCHRKALYLNVDLENSRFHPHSLPSCRDL